jgi:hypothetical protein
MCATREFVKTQGEGDSLNVRNVDKLTGIISLCGLFRSALSSDLCHEIGNTNDIEHIIAAGREINEGQKRVYPDRKKMARRQERCSPRQP